MCGIAGYLTPDRRADASLVRAMCDQIRHRGPDDEGFHVDGGCGIGMRRLSIIDLSTGHQPISNEDGSVWVVFNGEIYNYQELRAGPDRAQGHQLHDQQRHRNAGSPLRRGRRGRHREAARHVRLRHLGCARAQPAAGARPLRQKAAVLRRHCREGFYFGSELKCLRAAGVPLDIDRRSAAAVLPVRLHPGSAGALIAAMRKLPPGGWLTLRRDGTIEQGRYWKLPAPAEPKPRRVSTETPTRGSCASVRRIRAAAHDRRCAAGRVPERRHRFQLVVASMALQSKEPVKTFSIGFEEAAFNELPYARDGRARSTTPIITRSSCGRIRSDLMSRLVRHFDEPFGDSSAIPTYHRFASSPRST